MSDSTHAVSVLFVCMGNICRSPTAEGVFAAQVAQAGLAGRIRIDSAGTHGYHLGSPPDARAQRAASRRGYQLGSIRSRRVNYQDFTHFDYLLAMDRANLQDLLDLCPPGTAARIQMLMGYAEASEFEEVPDPYYGGPNGFERVLDLVEVAGAGLLAHLRREHRL